MGRAPTWMRPRGLAVTTVPTTATAVVSPALTSSMLTYLACRVQQGQAVSQTVINQSVRQGPAISHGAGSGTFSKYFLKFRKELRCVSAVQGGNEPSRATIEHSKALELAKHEECGGAVWRALLRKP